MAATSPFGLQAGNNLSDLGNAATARASLGTRIVLNVRKDFGAKGDLAMVLDAAITSGTADLTSASAGFAPSDVGKTVSVIGAGAATGTPAFTRGNATPTYNLVTTISAYVSASHVTLAANASTTVSSAVMWRGTDDTTAIQNALNAAGIGGAELAFDPVGFMVAGALQDAGDDTRWNAQLKLPSSVYPAAPSVIALVGHRQASGIGYLGGGSQPPANSGTVIYSPIAPNPGSATAPAILAANPFGNIGAGAGFSEVAAVVRNITFRLSPWSSLWAVQQGKGGCTFVENCSVDIDGVGTMMTAAPIGGGLVLPQVDNNAQTSVRNYAAFGRGSGILTGEHAICDSLSLGLCATAIRFRVGGHGSHYGRVLAQQCPVVLAFEGGPHCFRIERLEIEANNISISPLYGWAATTADIQDTRNYAQGDILYQRTHPGCTPFLERLVIGNGLCGGVRLLCPSKGGVQVAAGLSASQPVPRITKNVVVFNAASANTGQLNTSTGVFTCDEPGFYHVSTALCWSLRSVASGTRIDTRIIKNGIVFINVIAQASGGPYLSPMACGVVPMLVGDTLEIQAYQESSGSQDVAAIPGSTYLQVYKQ